MNKPFADRVAELETLSPGSVDYFDLMPRVPAPEAIAAATLGIKLFSDASAEEREELRGTLTWLLFSPLTREEQPNPVHDELKAFASGKINPEVEAAGSGSLPFRYECWHELAQVLVAGGAKYCPDTSAQLESLFCALTAQQGASKLNISQIQAHVNPRATWHMAEC